MSPSDKENPPRAFGRIHALIASAALIATILASSHAQQNSGFTSLFNGSDLSGWGGDLRYWSVQDGAITGRTTEEQPLRANTFLVWQGGPLRNFELHASFRISPEPRSNSGIQYRSRVVDPENWVVAGYQADFDASNRWTGILYEERGRAILAQVGQRVRITRGADKHVIEEIGSTGVDAARLQAALRPDGWNDYVIIADGPHLRQYINGLLTVEVFDEDASAAAAEGIIALQLHSGPPMWVQFKDVLLKRLP